MQYQTDAASSAPAPQAKNLRDKRAVPRKYAPIPAAINHNKRLGHKTGSCGNASRPKAITSGPHSDAATSQGLGLFGPTHSAVQTITTAPITYARRASLETRATHPNTPASTNVPSTNAPVR